MAPSRKWKTSHRLGEIVRGPTDDKELVSIIHKEPHSIAKRQTFKF